MVAEVDKKLDPGCILNTKLTGFADRVDVGEREREVKPDYSRGQRREFTMFHCISGFVLVVVVVVLNWGDTRLLCREETRSCL